MNRFILVLGTAAILIGVYMAAMLLLDERESGRASSAANSNASSLEREHSPTAGSADARVTIVEFFDPACETCRVFHPIVKGILQDHPGKVRLVVRYLPLHQGSEEVVKILEAARMQGKFWEALEAGFASQDKWAIHHRAHPDLFWRSIAGVGLDPEQASRDVQSPAVLSNIQRDSDDGRLLGVDKTPGFFVNGKPLLQFGRRQLLQLVNEALESEYGG